MFTKNEKIAIERGVLISKDGKAYGVKGNLIKYKNSGGYYSFKIKINGKTKLVPAHRVQAYLKYGDEIYKDGIMVRHLDGDQLNNTWDNIVIGTASDNRMDIPKNKRIKSAKIASSMNGKSYTKSKINAIKKDLQQGMSYSKVMEKYKISSKGTISYINHHNYGD